MDKINEITENIIGSAIEVHRHLGPGLLESAYQIALAREMAMRGIFYEQEKSIPLEYKGVKLDCCYRLDFVVENCVIVEIKSIESLLPIHDAQLLTYLRLTGCKIGLLINFNVRVLKYGLKRLAL
jgi:GxxExxY protein